MRGHTFVGLALQNIPLNRGGDCSLSAPPSLIQVQYPARDHLAILH